MKDIIIIGAGPAGISMAVEAVNAGISTEKYKSWKNLKNTRLQ